MQHVGRERRPAAAARPPRRRSPEEGRYERLLRRHRDTEVTQEFWALDPFNERGGELACGHSGAALAKTAPLRPRPQAALSPLAMWAEKRTL